MKSDFELLSPDHCLVRMQYYHPRLGYLIVDEFQRTHDEVREVKNSCWIYWQGLLLRVNKVSTLYKAELHSLACDYHIVMVDPDYLPLAADSRR